MPKEVLFEIIKKGLYLIFALIIIAHALGNIIYLKLILRLNNAHIGLKKMAPAVIGCTAYTLFGKQIFPGVLYPILLAVFVTCMIYFINKTN